MLLKIQFGNSQERFDNLTYPAIANVERKSFRGNYYKVHFASATLKIFLLNDRRQVFAWLVIFECRNDLHADLDYVITAKDKDSL